MFVDIYLIFEYYSIPVTDITSDDVDFHRRQLLSRTHIRSLFTGNISIEVRVAGRDLLINNGLFSLSR